MPRGTKIMLSFADWPAEDQERWQQALKPTDRFEESSLGAHLAPSNPKSTAGKLRAIPSDLSRFSTPSRLSHPPEARIDRTTLAEYVAWRRTSCEESALVYDLQALRDALKLIAPSTDWSWLLSVAKRMTAAAPAQRTKYHLITSDRLYLLGLELMDRRRCGGEFRRPNNQGTGLSIPRRFDHCPASDDTAAQRYSYGTAHWPPSGEGWRSMGA